MVMMMEMMMMRIPAIQQGLQGRVEEKEEQLRLAPNEQPQEFSKFMIIIHFFL